MYFFLKFEKGVNYISFVFRTNRCGVKAISEFATHITEYGNIEVFAIASERLEGEIMECINYVYFFGGKCYGIHEFGYNSIANIEEYSSKMVENPEWSISISDSLTTIYFFITSCLE